MSWLSYGNVTAAVLAVMCFGCLAVEAASEGLSADLQQEVTEFLQGWDPSSRAETEQFLVSHLKDNLRFARDTGEHRRVKRQLLYLVLNFLGEESIRSYVKNMKTENIPSMMGSVGPDDILYIVSSLPSDEIMRVLTSLPATDVLNLAKQMTPSQLVQLLGYVPPAGLTNLTNGFTPEELQQLVVLLPPEGIVNLTKTVPPPQAKKLLRSMSPEAIYNLTLSMSPKTLVDLMTALPPEIVLDLTQTLSPENLEKLLKAIPPEVMMTLITSLPPDTMRSLIGSLPPGFIESFVENISPQELGQMVKSLNAEQLAKLLTSFPAESMPNVSKLLTPERLNNVLSSLPGDLIANLTVIISPDQLSRLLASIPKDLIHTVTSSISADHLVGLISSIPPKTFSTLIKAVPPETLVSLASSIPAALIVNLTIAMSSEREVIAEIFEAVTPELITSFSASFSRGTILDILTLLPNDSISNLASAIPAPKALELFNSFSSGLPTKNIEELMKDIPTPLLVKLVNAVPPEVVANMSEQFTVRQLKKMIRAVTPEMFKFFITTIPPKTLVRIGMAIPEKVVSNALSVLQPKQFRSLVQAVPIETITSLVDAAFAGKPEEVKPSDLLATTQKIANILLTVPPATLTRLIKAIPREIFPKVIDVLTPETIAEGAAILSGEEGVPLVTALPAEAIAYAVSVIPPQSIEKVVDALPKRTIGAFANMAMEIPAVNIEHFFQLVPVGTLRHIVTQLPPKTIEKLASSLPPETVGKMAHSFSPVTVAPIMESLRPRELRRLIRSVNTTTLSNLLNSIPQDVIVNLTQALPPEQIAKLFGAIPPEIISTVVMHLDPVAMVALMKSMPPSLIENMLASLPNDLIINMTRKLPPAQMQEMMNLLPPAMIGKMTAMMPQDVLVDLVTTLDPDAMLGMMQKLDSKQLIDILSSLPPHVVLNLTKSQTPEQTMNMLGSLPADGIVNLTRVFPTEMFLEMMQSLPPEGVLKLMTSMPLGDLFKLAGQLTPDQVAKVIETFTADKDFIPNLMASIDLDRILGMVEAVPSDLILQIASSVDMNKIMPLVQRFLPKVQKMVQDKIEDAMTTLSKNSTLTFQECLSDLQIVVNSVFNFSEWAFHLIDASGKPSRGMLQGNIHMIGNFDQCKMIRHVIGSGPREGDAISGSYCHVQFDIPKEQLPPIPGDGILPMPEIAMDVCLPDSCKAVDIHRFLKTLSLPLGVTVPKVACQEDAQLTSDPAAIITLIVITIIISFVVVATVVDCVYLRQQYSFPVNNNDKRIMSCGQGSFTNGHTPTLGHSRDGKGKSAKVVAEDEIKAREKLLQKDAESGVREVIAADPMMKKSGLENAEDKMIPHSSAHDAREVEIRMSTDDNLLKQIVKAFSIPRSIRTLVRPRHDGNSNVHCLHGIRVLSMLWVIFANTVVFSALNFENLLHAANDLISMPAQIILNSSLAQDTFFAISGVVTALAFFKGVEKGVTILKIVYYYVHRLVRIIPAYAVVLLICTCLLSYVATGPHWPPPLQEQCLQQWWMNILFINNYFTSIEHMCMSWTWFLSNLMQFYWIAPIVLVPLAFSKKTIWLRVIGLSLLGLLVLVHVVLTAFLEIGVNGDVLRRQSEYFWVIYQQPYCRVAPFAVGMGLGFLLHRTKFQFHMGKAAMCIGWVITLATSTTLTLVTYDENRYLLEDASGWSLSSRVVHETVQRPLWGLVVCWVVFACATGHGGAVNTVLSWRGFLPLSRLTYCVYLIHPVVILCDLFAYRVFAYFTIGYVVFRYIGYVVVSYILALVLAVLTEAPFMALERAIISCFQSKPTSSV